ncbi:MAG TPA: sugar ABC transporter permease [Clostridiaceae bacterium]|jgi:arabinogalactan oligomer/maltooligosaccharide transport system permease protein|nr:sugar ABC transporter permease [Clostridiaceae bacterium]HBF77417.1 sugar ABC transporter permease [Clostridiaceae bacterium]HBG39088.1 sugar ABC transporter permease [Clostridiaceae bacterium]HBN28314.1 sugar ABC transporter permease [Clostridiaceae bacterium]HBX48197.1 sugar ABC transporter permease [Clostridiaceae bacterium]
MESSTKQIINKPLKNKSLNYKHKLNPSEKRKLLIERILIWFAILLVLIPILFVVSAALAKGDAFYQEGLFQGELTLENFSKVIKETDFLIWFKNSMIVCTTVSVFQLLMTATAAYAFSRMRFKGRRSGLMSLLILQMFPGMMTIPAILTLAYKWDFLDKIWALILILSGGSAYNIWLLKGYFDGIPIELDEAAMVDGASHWKIFWKIIMPLSRPMIAVIFLFCFIGIYSEFPMSSALLKDSGNYTMTLGLQSFINNKFSAHWTQYSAAALMAALPITIIFMALQKFIAKGLVAGAVKG